MSINGAQAEKLWSTLQPFTLDVLGGYSLDLSAELQINATPALSVTPLGITSGMLAAGSVVASKLGGGAVLAASIGFVATDIPYGVTTVGLALDNCMYLDGTRPLTNTWDVGGFEIQNVASPTLASSAVNKSYVDSSLASGVYFRAPAVPDQIQNGLSTTAGWLRAGAAYYMDALPSPGDTITVHGITFTFVTGAPIASTDIELEASKALTLDNAVTQMLACTDLTTDGIAFNLNFIASSPTALDYLFLVVINEDPPNTPSDGNDKVLSTACTAMKLAYSFRGGALMTYSDLGTHVDDLVLKASYTYSHPVGWSLII